MRCNHTEKAWGRHVKGRKRGDKGRRIELLGLRACRHIGTYGHVLIDMRRSSIREPLPGRIRKPHLHPGSLSIEAQVHMHAGYCLQTEQEARDQQRHRAALCRQGAHFRQCTCSQLEALVTLP